MYKLYSATVELTRKCNARCKHCIVDALYAKENEMTTERILSLIEELHDEGCGTITLTGGEPFLREEWPLFVQKAYALNMQIVMMSNGLKIDEPIIKVLKLFNVALGISLDGCDAETHDKIRGVRGIFDNFVKLIPKLKEAGIYVAIPTTVMKSNFDQLDKIRDLLIDLKVDAWQLQVVKPSGRLENDDEILTEEQYYKLAEKIVEYRRDFGDKLSITEADCIGYNSVLTPGLGIQEWRGCECGIYSVSIESDGNVKGCPNMNNSEGNVSERPFKEIWQSHDSFKYNRMPNPESLIGFCRECEHRYVCRGGCPTNPRTGKNVYCLHKIETIGVDK